MVGEHVGVDLGHERAAELLRVDGLIGDFHGAPLLGPLQPRHTVGTLRNEVVEDVAAPRRPAVHAVILEHGFLRRLLLEDS